MIPLFSQGPARQRREVSTLDEFVLCARFTGERLSASMTNYKLPYWYRLARATPLSRTPKRRARQQCGGTMRVSIWMPRLQAARQVEQGVVWCAYEMRIIAKEGEGGGC